MVGCGLRAGESFGYRDGDALFSQDGRQVGRFHENEVYGVDGHYLGELGDIDRLLTRLSRVGKTRAPFSPRSRVGRLGRMSRMARAMRAGCQEFPLRVNFRGLLLSFHSSLNIARVGNSFLQERAAVHEMSD